MQYNNHIATYTYIHSTTLASYNCLFNNIGVTHQCHKLWHYYSIATSISTFCFNSTHGHVDAATGSVVTFSVVNATTGNGIHSTLPYCLPFMYVYRGAYTASDNARAKKAKRSGPRVWSHENNCLRGVSLHFTLLWINLFLLLIQITVLDGLSRDAAKKSLITACHHMITWSCK